MRFLDSVVHSAHYCPVRRAGVVVLSASILVSAAFAAPAARITPTSVAGAKLGLRANAYKQLFGKPVRKDALRYPTKWTRLVFTQRKVAVFLPPNGKAVQVATWNPKDKTARGIGPCSSISKLKAAYGTSLKPSKYNKFGNRVYAYTVGKLIFAATGHEPKPGPSKHVTAIALYSGPLNLASFLAQQPENSAIKCP
jgi:hypothetical protein